VSFLKPTGRALSPARTFVHRRVMLHQSRLAASPGVAAARPGGRAGQQGVQVSTGAVARHAMLQAASTFLVSYLPCWFRRDSAAEAIATPLGR
jgi:hypothetical protein